MPYLDSVEELLEAKEGEHVQFKEAKNRFDFGEAARCCCALANDGGGKLVFGISDKRPRSVVGSRAFEQPERTRMGLIDKLKINVDFQLFTYEEKRVLVFDVKSRPIGLPILYEGVAWIYDGDTLKEMPEEKRRKIYEEIGTDFSGKICDGVTIKDLDETAIEAFRAKWIEKSGNKKLATRSKEQILIDCGAMTDAGVTYAALILFGKARHSSDFCHRRRLSLNTALPRPPAPQTNGKNSSLASLPATIAFGSWSTCGMINSIIKRASLCSTSPRLMSVLFEKLS